MGYRVPDKFRTNPLSLKPGGVIVYVKFKNGSIREYDKVKNPSSYIKQIKYNDANPPICWWESTYVAKHYA